MAAGISFSPLGQQNGQQQNGQTGSPQATSPVQDAIRLISLKLPSVVGPTAASPLAFSTPSPLGGQLNSALAQNWLQGLLGQQPNGPTTSDLFAQLMQSIGAPSFESQSPANTPAAGHPSIKLNNPGDLGTSIGGSLGQPSQTPPMNMEQPREGRMPVPAFRAPLFGGIPAVNGGFTGGIIPNIPDFNSNF